MLSASGKLGGVAGVLVGGRRGNPEVGFLGTATSWKYTLRAVCEKNGEGSGPGSGSVGGRSAGSTDF